MYGVKTQRREREKKEKKRNETERKRNASVGPIAQVMTFHDLFQNNIGILIRIIYTFYISYILFHINHVTNISHDIIKLSPEFQRISCYTVFVN